MFKNYRDKIALSGITVLMIGIILLIFTFVSAYGFLTAGVSIIATQDLIRTFGESLAPLIAACIHIMYLGVMGWIGSLITVRGVTIIAHAPPAPTIVQAPPQPAPEPKPQPHPQLQPQKPKTEKPIPEKPKEEKPKEEKPKEEVKPLPEPQFVVIPPEQVAPTAPASPPAEQKPQQNNNAPPSQ